jgi:hypothetical protein
MSVMRAAPAMLPMGEMIRELGTSLVTPVPDDWQGRLRHLLDPLREAFAQHRAATEGDEGLYAGVVNDAPRLAGAVDSLVAEHDRLDSAMARLAVAMHEVDQDADTLLRRALAVLDDLKRHGQSDADLVLEAYVTDIGGE